MNFQTAEDALNVLRKNISGLDWKNSSSDRELVKFAILSVVNKISVYSKGDITVLYSGYVNGKDSFDIAKNMVNDPNIRLLNKTQAFSLLNNDEFKDIQAHAFGYDSYRDMDDHLKSIHGNSNSIYDTPEKKFEGDGKSGLWAIISRNFAAETVGEVRIVTVYPREDSVLAATEIETLLKEQKATKIDGSTLDEIMASGNPKGYVIANAASRTFLADPSVDNYGTWLDVGDDAVFKQLLDNSSDAVKIGLQNALDQVSDRFGSAVSLSVTNKIPDIDGGKHLPIIGWGFTLLAALSVSKEAKAAEEAGDSDRAKEIWAEFAVGELGGEIAGTVGGAVGSLAAIAVLGLSAPVAAVAGVAVGIVAGIYGEDFAKELYQLTKDMDGNQRMDLFDRLSTFAFGQDFQPKNLPEALSQKTVTLTAEMPVSELVEKAKTDIAYRYALRELMPVIASGASEEDFAPFNQDGSLNLFDADHPQGMTESYIRDRAAMLLLQMRYLKNGLKLNRDLVDDLVQGDWDYIDYAQHPFAGDADRPLELSIDGNGIMTDNHRVIFGTDNNPKGEEVLEGGGRADRLYGWGGNDTLKGGTGNDYMEGGTGHDAYYIQNHDTILDSDGQGKILFASGSNTLEARHFMTVSPDAQMWKSVDVTDNTFDNQFRAWREGDNLHIMRLNADGWISSDFEGTANGKFTAERQGGNLLIIALATLSHCC